MSKIGIIGGSGLDDPDILEGSSETSIKTPYGDPSSKIKEGKILETTPKTLYVWEKDIPKKIKDNK